MKLSVLLILLLCSIPLFSQQTDPISSRTYISLAYFGEKVFHPGLKASFNRSQFLSKKSIKNRLDYGIGLAGYVHPESHTGLRIAPELIYIHTGKKSFEWGIGIDAGYMHRFYNGRVFTVDAAGEVNESRLAGDANFSYGAFIHLGQNQILTKGKGIRWYVQIGAFQEFTFNSYHLLHPSLTLGISKYLKL